MSWELKKLFLLQLTFKVAAVRRGSLVVGWTQGVLGVEMAFLNPKVSMYSYHRAIVKYPE